MKTRTTYVLLLLLATMVAIPGARAQGPFMYHRGPGHPGMGMGMGIQRFSDELNLTNDQLVKIKGARFDLQKKGIEIRSKIQLAELELHELMQAETPNENQVKGKIETIGKLRTELRLAQVGGMLSIQQVLSADQKAKLKELRQQKRTERGDRRPRMQRGQGPQGFRGFDDNFDFENMDLIPGSSDESEEI